MSDVGTRSGGGCFLLAFGGFLLILAFLPGRALAQAEWISRMDDDHNGYIEPDEVSDRAREYLERFTRPYGLSLSRPNSVRILEEAARRYYSNRQRGDQDEPPAMAVGVPGFASEPDKPLIPGFGSAEVRFPYNREDLERAESIIDRYDSNNDGSLDQREVAEGRWREGNPYENDFNRDGRLSVDEMAQRYARRRFNESRSQMALLRSGGEENTTSRDERQENSNDRWRDWRGSRSSRAGQSSNGDRGARSLAESILQRYDFNRNSLLDPNEMESVGLALIRVDYGRDGRVDEGELAQYLMTAFESTASESQELIPTWFFEKDLDGDQQVLMSEFTDEWTVEKLDEFTSFDANRDGILTANEVLAAKSVVGGTFVNRQAQVILPHATIVSEIEVDEDYLIGDLNVRLSISHTYTDHLDGYLIGPDGERLELFSGVGGSDDHFDKTLFDDEAGNSITRARAPFEGSYQPESMAKRQPGLSKYKGKNLKGVWQLMVRASRSDRSGILHGWSLEVTPSKDAVNELGETQRRLQEAAEEPPAEASTPESSDSPREEENRYRSRRGDEYR